MIAMDVDGTLLDRESRVPAENLAAVSEAAARGIEIVLVTGRRYAFVQSIAEQLPCDLHLIVSNGALIKSKNGETHQRLLLPSEIARRVLGATGHFRAHAAMVFDRPGAGQVIFEKIDWDDPIRGGYFRRNREFLAEVNPLCDCLNGEDPIQVMYTGPCQLMRGAMRTLQGLTEARDFTLALTEYEDRDFSILDVLRSGVTKGVALKEWATRRGIERHEVMAIGDNWNDREMLEFAGQPVVMGNAVEELKSQGWPVTLDNHHGGLGVAIRKYAFGEVDGKK